METGMGSVPGRSRGSARQGSSVALTGLPSLPFSPGSPRSPLKPLSPCSGDRHGVTGQAGTFPGPAEGCAQQCPHPGLCSLLTWETYNLRPCLLWVPARPQLRAHPVRGRRQMPSALADHHPQPQPMMLAQLSCLSCLLLSDQPRTLAPLGPMGPRSPGRPIRLPSTTSTCGQGTVRASTRGTSGRISQGQSPPQAPEPRHWMWPSIPREAGWHLDNGPQQQPSPTLGPGGPGGPGRPSLP